MGEIVDIYLLKSINFIWLIHLKILIVNIF